MKARRQMKVQEIITKQIIHTQEDLADKLRLAGFDVTQATVSRDIKEMGLIKVLVRETNIAMLFRANIIQQTCKTVLSVY